MSIDEAYSDEMMENVYKFLVIGDVGVGKTSIVRRYVKGKFTDNCKPTIGVDFALKTIQWDRNTLIRAQLWDIAGQERFGHMTRVYYKDCIAAVIVFDVTRSTTFDGVLKWKNDLDSKCTVEGEPVPTILIANKIDLIPSNDNNNNNKGLPGPSWAAPVAPSEMDSFCKEHGFLGWFETSAKDATLSKGFEEAMMLLIRQVRKALDLETIDDLDSDTPIPLNIGKPGANNTGGACWCS